MVKLPPVRRKIVPFSEMVIGCMCVARSTPSLDWNDDDSETEERKNLLKLSAVGRCWQTRTASTVKSRVVSSPRG